MNGFVAISFYKCKHTVRFDPTDIPDLSAGIRGPRGTRIPLAGFQAIFAEKETPGGSFSRATLKLPRHFIDGDL